MRALRLAWLVGAVACAAKPSSDVGPTARADSSAVDGARLPENDKGALGNAPSAAAPAPSASAPATVPRKGWVHFELVPREGGVRALVAKISPFGVEREAALVPPEHRCVAATGAEVPTGEPRTVKIGCGMEAVAELSLSRDQAVRLIRSKTGEELPLPVPADVSLWISPLLPDPATPSGCDDAKPAGRAIPATVAIRPGGTILPNGSSVFLVIPALGVDVRMGPWARAYCHAFYTERTRRYEAHCSEGEYWPKFDAYFKGDGLFFHYVDAGIDHAEAVPLGGVRVPCGARVRFPAIHHVDPRYEGFQGRCRQQCDQVQDMCMDSCERHPPATDLFAECHTRCYSAHETCWRKTCGRW